MREGGQERDTHTHTHAHHTHILTCSLMARVKHLLKSWTSALPSHIPVVLLLLTRSTLCVDAFHCARSLALARPHASSPPHLSQPHASFSAARAFTCITSHHHYYCCRHGSTAYAARQQWQAAAGVAVLLLVVAGRVAVTMTTTWTLCPARVWRRSSPAPCCVPAWLTPFSSTYATRAVCATSTQPPASCHPFSPHHHPVGTVQRGLRTRVLARRHPVTAGRQGRRRVQVSRHGVHQERQGVAAAHAPGDAGGVGQRVRVLHLPPPLPLLACSHVRRVSLLAPHNQPPVVHHCCAGQSDNPAQPLPGQPAYAAAAILLFES